MPIKQQKKVEEFIEETPEVKEAVTKGKNFFQRLFGK